MKKGFVGEQGWMDKDDEEDCVAYDSNDGDEHVDTTVEQIIDELVKLCCVPGWHQVVHIISKRNIKQES